MKIDAFSHVRPRAYAEVVERLVGGSAGMARFGGRAGAASARPEMAPLWDASLRIKHLDDAEVDKQVIQDKPIWIHPYFNPSRPDPEIDLQGLNIAQVLVGRSTP